MNHGHCKFCALHFHSLNSFRRLRGKIRKIRTFNEEKEAFWVSEQDAEGFDYHLHQGWVAVGSKLSVSLKLHVRVGEQTCAEISFEIRHQSCMESYLLLGRKSDLRSKNQ